MYVYTYTNEFDYGGLTHGLADAGCYHHTDCQLRSTIPQTQMTIRMVVTASPCVTPPESNSFVYVYTYIYIYIYIHIYIYTYIRHRASARERERLPPTSPTPFNLVQVWGSRSEVQGGGAPPLECVFLGGGGCLLASSCVSPRSLFLRAFLHRFWDSLFQVKCSLGAQVGAQMEAKCTPTSHFSYFMGTLILCNSTMFSLDFAVLVSPGLPQDSSKKRL